MRRQKVLGVVALSLAVTNLIALPDTLNAVAALRGGGGSADKGTTVRHEVFEAGAIFSSASVNGWARLVALTPFVPISREAGEGDYGVRKRSFRPR